MNHEVQKNQPQYCETHRQPRALHIEFSLRLRFDHDYDSDDSGGLNSRKIFVDLFQSRIEALDQNDEISIRGDEHVLAVIIDV